MTQYAFFQGAIVPIEQAKVSIMKHALNYGTGCFEGIRAYWNEDDRQLYVFRMLEHYQRLLQSTKILMMSPRYTAEQLCDLRWNCCAAKAIGPMPTFARWPTSPTRSSGCGCTISTTICASGRVPYDRYVENEEGAHVGFSSWQRVSDNNIPPRGKITGAYVNSAFIKTEADVERLRRSAGDERARLTCAKAARRTSSWCAAAS